jgi:hypothetical protein
VISSAWREAHTLQQLRAFFSLDIARRIIGATPLLACPENSGQREQEIKAWLRSTGRENEEWVALDDTPSLFSLDCPNLLHVDGEIGFNNDVESALRKRLATSRG